MRRAAILLGVGAGLLIATEAGCPARGTDSGPPATDSAPPGTDSAPPGTDASAPGTDSATPSTDAAPFMCVEDALEPNDGCGSPYIFTSLVNTGPVSAGLCDAHDY